MREDLTEISPALHWDIVKGWWWQDVPLDPSRPVHGAVWLQCQAWINLDTTERSSTLVRYKSPDQWNSQSDMALLHNLKRSGECWLEFYWELFKVIQSSMQFMLLRKRFWCPVSRGFLKLLHEVVQWWQMSGAASRHQSLCRWLRLKVVVRRIIRNNWLQLENYCLRQFVWCIWIEQEKMLRTIEGHDDDI